MEFIGKFFKGLSIFLSIVHNIIWSAIGIAVIFGIFYIVSNGPAKIIQNILPSQPLQENPFEGNSQNQENNQKYYYQKADDQIDKQDNKQNIQQNSSPQITDEQKKCAIGVLGQGRFEELMKGSNPPTSQEMSKLQPCFPNGLP